MKVEIAGVGLCLLALGGATNADDNGRTIYQQHCVPCHAPGSGNPGTMRLTELRGSDAAVLTQRHDLQATYVKSVVRNGLLEMPPFRPTEITDTELNAVARYLTAGD